VGTDEVYGDVSEGLSSENDTLNPSSPYAATKAAADMLVLAYHRTYRLKTILTRCTNNFGPYQFPEKLIPKTIIRAIHNLTIPLYGSGKQVRDWIYVADHCEALDLIIRKGTPGSVYNIAGGNQTDNFRLVKTILRTLDKPEKLIQHVEDRPGHDMRYGLDGSKIKKELGWQPRHNFEKALSTTIEWYKTNEDWWKPIANDNVLSASPWRLKW
jgi:dTDP-glucose 4,6-dehydratase